MNSQKVAFITGSTDGIGKAVALRLLNEGWEVIINGRNKAKCEQTVDELIQKSGNNSISYYVADLSNLSEVKEITDKFNSTHSRLDLLLLNANSISNKRIITAEGNEQNFALGYLSRIVMIQELETVLENTPKSQILSIIGMDTQPIDFNDPTIAKKYKCRKGIARWQWAMVLFTIEYNKTSKVPLNLYMPGLVNTKILSSEPQPIRAFVKIVNIVMGLEPEQAAKNIETVLKDIVDRNKRGTCYSYKKESGIPTIKIREKDVQNLLKLTLEKL